MTIEQRVRRRLATVFSRLAFLAAFAVVVFVHSNASAEDRGRHVVVVVEGAGSDDVAAAIAAHVDSPHRVDSPQAFRSALAKHGWKTIAPGVTSKGRAAQLVKQARASAQETNVDVVILAVVAKTKRAITVRVWVIDLSKDGVAVDDSAPLAPTATVQDEADAVWTRASDLLPKPPAPAPPAPTPAPTPAAAPVDSSADAVTDAMKAQRRTRAGALLIVELAMEGAARSFTYTDRLTPTLRSYDLKAPMGAAHAELYPFARTSLPFLRGFGVTGGFARAFAISSADSNGTRVGTSWQAFDVGARERLNLSSRLILGVSVGFGGVDFKFDQTALAATLPSVAYQFLRGGLDLRGSFGAFSIFGGGAYLPVLSAGAIGNAFPHEHVGGIDARLGAAYMMTPGLELSLGVGYTRFFYSMKPVPGDANVAGGALDQFGSVALGIGYLL